MRSHALCRLVVPTSPVAHNPVCTVAVLRRRTLICRLRDMFEEVREILDRPRSIPRSLSFHRALPSHLARSLEKHRDIHVGARSFVQRMQPLDHDKIRRLDIDLTSACVRFETPPWHTRRATSAKLAQIMGETNEV